MEFVQVHGYMEDVQAGQDHVKDTEHVQSVQVDVEQLENVQAV